MKIQISKTFKKDMDAIKDKKIKKNIIEKVNKIPEGDIKKLKGYEHMYRLRIGNYRVLFKRINDEITLYDVKLRKEVY